MSETGIPARQNPYKLNREIKQLARAPWWLLFILGGTLLFAIEKSDDALYTSAWERVRKGLEITIEVTLLAYGLALLLGLIFALLRRPSQSVIYNIFVYQPVTVVVETLRGIPTLVLLFYVTLALVPQLVTLGNELGADMLERNMTFLGLASFLEELRIRDISIKYRAVVALALSYSAFLSEVYRAGIDSIPKGQREAARSLGMSSWQVNRYIVLPQAIRVILPPLGNDFIAMLKESSLISVVGVLDIMGYGRQFNASTFTLFPGYNTVALTYLVLTLTLSMGVKLLEFIIDRGKDRT